MFLKTVPYGSADNLSEQALGANWNFWLYRNWVLIKSNTFYRHTGLVIINIIPSKIADTTQRFDTPGLVSSSGVIWCWKLQTLYTRQHDVICQQGANNLVANSYRHPH